MLLLQDETADSAFELLPHPFYSPDLVPSEFFMFPKLTYRMRGCHFGNNGEILCAGDKFLDD